MVAVGPTAIDTPLTHERLKDPELGGDLLARIPLGRFGQINDVVVYSGVPSIPSRCACQWHNPDG